MRIDDFTEERWRRHSGPQEINDRAERHAASWGHNSAVARLARAGVPNRVQHDPVLVLEGVSSSVVLGSADFGVSRDGSLVYVPGKVRGTDRRVAVALGSIAWS